MELQEFTDECAKRHVTSIKLMSAITSEEKLNTLILDHVSWQGAAETHVGKSLCGFNVWDHCRKIKFDSEKASEGGAATGVVPPVTEGDAEMLWAAFRKRTQGIRLQPNMAIFRAWWAYRPPTQFEIATVQDTDRQQTLVACLVYTWTVFHSSIHLASKLACGSFPRAR